MSAEKCRHKWQPLSFVFETQLLDGAGRVHIRQPDLERGRVYCVCMRCFSHTYIETKWLGGYIDTPAGIGSGRRRKPGADPRDGRQGKERP